MTGTRKVCNSDEGRPPPAKRRRRSAALPLKEHNHQLIEHNDMAELGVKVISAAAAGSTNDDDEDIENLRTSAEDSCDPSEKSGGRVLRLSGEKKHFSTNCYSPTLDGSLFRITGDEPSFFEPPPTEEENYFNLLSDEIASRIFYWLPKHTLSRTAQVCRRFRRLTADPIFWRRLDLGARPSVAPRVLDLILGERGVVAFRATRSAFESPLFSPDQSAACSEYKLRYADFGGCNISAAAFELIFSRCTELRKVGLEMCDVSEAALMALAENNHRLETLHLGMVKQPLLGPALFTLMANSSQSLMELNLAWSELSADSLTTLCCQRKLPPNLERLNLSGCRDSLSDDHIDSLSRRCPRLKELDISDAIMVTGKSVTSISGGMRKLESLSMSRCYSVVPAAYLQLGSSASPSLKYLNIFGVMKDDALNELNARLTRIELNKFMFSSIARPTVGIKRTSIWNIRVRD